MTRTPETLRQLAALLRGSAAAAETHEAEAEAAQLAAELELEAQILADPDQPRRPRCVSVWRGEGGRR